MDSDRPKNLGGRVMGAPRSTKKGDEMKRSFLLVIGILFFTASLSHATDKIIIDGFNNWARGKTCVR
jgi:hypothetical protein